MEKSLQNFTKCPNVLLASGGKNLIICLVYMLTIFFLVPVSQCGSCFGLRLVNGRCYKLLYRNHMSKQECCLLGAFYTNQYINESLYVRDIVLRRDGINQCEFSCPLESTTKESCNKVICSKGYTCKHLVNKAVCHCSRKCSQNDIKSGPVCSTDYRRFKNRCIFNRERCANPNVMLEEVKCPQLENRCISIGCAKHDSFNKSTNLHLNCLKVCPKSQICVIRQYNGKPRCEYADSIGFSQTKYSTNGVLDLSISKKISQCNTNLFNKHICATNNITYKNHCDLKNASSTLGVELRIAYVGNCSASTTCANVKCLDESMTCVKHFTTHQPVCIDCSNNPPNCNPTINSPVVSSRLLTSTDLQVTGQQDQIFGDPRWHGKVTTNGWPRVCAANNQTFPNTCFLHIFSCHSKTYMDIVSTGNCLENS